MSEVIHYPSFSTRGNGYAARFEGNAVLDPDRFNKTKRAIREGASPGRISLARTSSQSPISEAFTILRSLAQCGAIQSDGNLRRWNRNELVAQRRRLRTA
jgi:hypothetical protein